MEAISNENPEAQLPRPAPLSKMPSNETDLVRLRHEHVVTLLQPKTENEDQITFEARREAARESIAIIDRILCPPPATWHIAGYDIELRDWSDRLTLVTTALAIPVALLACEPIRRFYFFWRHGRIPYPADYVEKFAISQQWDEAYTQRIIKSRYTPSLYKHRLFMGATCVGVYAWAGHLWRMLHRNSSQ
jgi:hypothetical protein